MTETPEAGPQPSRPATSPEQLGLSPRERLKTQSSQNIDRMKASFIRNSLERGVFATAAEAEEAVRQAREEVERNHALTKNLSPESMELFLITGQSLTMWDHLKEARTIETMRQGTTTQGKNLHDAYLEMRQSAEDGLRQYVNDSTSQHPVYFSVAGTQQELQVGSAAAYGNFFIELDFDQLADTSVYTHGDSFEGVTSESFTFDPRFVLDPSDALTAKAMRNLIDRANGSDAVNRFGTSSLYEIREGKPLDLGLTIEGESDRAYIEAAVFSPILLEQITTIGMVIQEASDLATFARLTTQFPAFAERVKITILPEAAQEMGALTALWLNRNYGDRVIYVQPESRKNMQESLATESQLGLSSESTIAEVQTSLRTICSAVENKPLYELKNYTTTKAKLLQVNRLLQRSTQHAEELTRYKTFVQDAAFFEQMANPFDRYVIDPTLMQTVLNQESFTDETMLNAIIRSDSSYGLQKAYAHSIGIAEDRSRTLKTHTEQVMAQFRTYYAQTWDSSLLSADQFRLMLALHDVGKPAALDLAGTKTAQHWYTQQLMPRILAGIDIPQAQKNIMVQLASSDYIGELLLYDLPPNVVATKMKQDAEALGINAQEYLQLATTFYMCDASSYTQKVSGVESALDTVIDFSEANGKQTLRLALDKQLKLTQLQALF